MPQYPWTTPITAQVTASSPELSFHPTNPQPKVAVVVPEPVQLAEDPQRDTFDYEIPVYVATNHGIPLGERRMVDLTLGGGFLEDPEWVEGPMADPEGSRFNSYWPVICFNPPDIRTDGVAEPFTAVVGTDYAPNWGNCVKAFRLELTEALKVTMVVDQLAGGDYGTWATLVGTNGLDLLWFGNYAQDHVSATVNLQPGVYMILAGPANVYRYSNPPASLNWDCTLTVTTVVPPPLPVLVDTVTDSLTSETPVTSLVQNWGVLYKFIPTVTGPHSFYLNASFDAFLAVHTAGQTQLGANDDFGSTNSRVENLQLTAGATYLVSASAYSAGAAGTYTLGVEVPAP